MSAAICDQLVALRKYFGSECKEIFSRITTTCTTYNVFTLLESSFLRLKLLKKYFSLFGLTSAVEILLCSASDTSQQLLEHGNCSRKVTAWSQQAFHFVRVQITAFVCSKDVSDYKTCRIPEGLLPALVLLYL